MANVTQPPILDDTGQAIVEALDNISASLHRNGIKVQYDESPALYAHAAGDLIYFNSIFYEVTQAISVGNTIAVGTNIKAASITPDTVVYVDDLPGAPGGGGTVKLPSSIQPSVSSVTLDFDNRSAVVTMTVVGDGTISATSSNPNITASLNGTTLTIAGSIASFGQNATITVSISETQNYSDAQTTISVADTAAWKTFATATDEEIAQMVAMADAGEIDLYEDCGWRVGQEHTITLGAIPSSGTYDGINWSVGENHNSETVTLVLMHRGMYELVTPVKNKDGSNRSTCSFVYGLKNCLYGPGYIHSTATNEMSWAGSARRFWCNGGFRQAMPSAIRNVTKLFKTITAQTYDGSTNYTSEDYFALPASAEVWKGDSSWGYGGYAGQPTANSNLAEFNALSRFTYYEVAPNRKKTNGDSGSSTNWWMRSPGYNDSRKFCYIYDSTTADNWPSDTGANATYGLSPFGCI